MLQRISKLAAICFVLLSLGVTQAGTLPIMNIHFGGPLANDCNFVDNEQVMASLYASLDVLSKIEESRQECQNIFYNSQAFLKSYLGVLKDQSTEISVAKANQRYIENEIEKLILEGTYAGEFDSDLLSIKQDLNRLQDSQNLGQASLSTSIEYGSLVMQELSQNQHCGKSFTNHVLSPSLSFMSGIMGFVSPVGAVASTLISQGLSFASYLVSYIGDITSGSYLALRDLTQSSNYYLSYKCNFENLEKMICALEEEENYSYDDYLSHLEEFLSKLDPNQEFRKYFDLKEHSYRLSKIFDSLEGIFNSAETYDDQIQIVTYQSRISKLALAGKQPPLKNKFYIEQMIAAGLLTDATGVDTWEDWDQNIITFSKWWFTYIAYGQDDYLYSKVNYYCERFEDNPRMWDAQNKMCMAMTLYKPEEIKPFIQKVVAPAMVDLQKEIKRLIGKVQGSANVQKLFTEIASQEVYLGHIDYREYKLTELLSLLDEHSTIFLDTPAYYLALEVQGVAKAISKLAAAVQTPREFATVAANVYSELASISNNGQGGQILYKGDLESKVASYFDEVSRYYLLTDHERAKRFAKYTTYRGMFEKFRDRLNLPDSQGSSNLSLALDIRDSFLKVFRKPIYKQIKADIKRYKKTHVGRRELTHACALFLPFMKDLNNIGTSGNAKLLGTSPARFCRKMLEKEGGIPILINDTRKYSLYPHGRPNFKEHCYYYNYKREVLTQRAYRFRQRAEGLKQ